MRSVRYENNVSKTPAYS